MAYQVKVEIDGTIYSGSYTIGRMGSTRIATVTSGYGVSSMQLGFRPEHDVASKLLREQVVKKALLEKR